MRFTYKCYIHSRLPFSFCTITLLRLPITSVIFSHHFFPPLFLPPRICLLLHILNNNFFSLSSFLILRMLINSIRSKRLRRFIFSTLPSPLFSTHIILHRIDYIHILSKNWLMLNKNSFFLNDCQWEGKTLMSGLWIEHPQKLPLQSWEYTWTSHKDMKWRESSIFTVHNFQWRRLF